MFLIFASSTESFINNIFKFKFVHSAGCKIVRQGCSENGFSKSGIGNNKEVKNSENTNRKFVAKKVGNPEKICSNA